jgi:hypothetical protein
MDMDRIYQGEDALWYFNVRGNQAKGPFESHSSAEIALRAHIRSCSRHIDVSRMLPKALTTVSFRRHRAQTNQS